MDNALWKSVKNDSNSNLITFKECLENTTDEFLNECEEIGLQCLLQNAVLCDRNQTIRLLNYVKDVDCKRMKFFIDSDYFPTHQIINPIISGINYGDDYELIEMFLKKGASIGLNPNSSSYMRKNMLCNALITRKYEIAKVIIKNAKDMEILLKQEEVVSCIEEPLTLILYSQNLDLIRTFSRHMDFSLVKNDMYYQMILESGTIAKKYTAIKIFIKFGLDLNDLSSKYKEFKEEKKNIENQLKKEYEIIDLILLGHYKDENSFFFHNFFPLDLVKFILLESELRYPRKVNSYSIKKIKLE